MTDFYYNDSKLQMNTRLILCFEELNNNKGKTSSIDTRLFIGWNKENNYYFVRGKRQDIGINEFVPYAFQCENVEYLCDFIELATYRHSSRNMILYNYNNLDKVNETEMIYEFFENNMDNNYEIVSYKNVKLTSSCIRNHLRLLKYML
jgi:hypothetical protein